MRRAAPQRALEARAVGVDARHARLGQQQRDLLLETLGAASDASDVEVAAIRAGARHRLREAAVVAAQRAVERKHAPRAAVRHALFQPGGAVQHCAKPRRFRNSRLVRYA
jgi:hypothetical protein